jgi:hypothetical protein
MNSLAQMERVAPILRAAVPEGARRLVRHSLTARAVRVSPDRVLLEQTIIPALLAQGFDTVLSVGVEQYTAHYPRRFASGNVDLWTIDIDPYHARWGMPGRHVTGDVRDLGKIFSRARFDAVLFNGIIGFGINDLDLAEEAIEGIAAVLKPNGWLVLGWNSDKGVDPMQLSSTRRWFTRRESGPLPSHMEVTETTHVFDHLRRLSSAADTEVPRAAPIREQ